MSIVEIEEKLEWLLALRHKLTISQQHVIHQIKDQEFPYKYTDADTKEYEKQHTFFIGLIQQELRKAYLKGVCNHQLHIQKELD